MAEGHTGHHTHKALAEGQGDEHNQQNVGDAHHQVDTPGDHRIHPSAAHSGYHTQHQGNDGADGGSQEADADAER